MGGYIGDGYPLCVDLPERAFLKKGAGYRYLGNSPLPELMSDPSQFATDKTIKRLVLSTSSHLYRKLCNSNNGGESNCNYQNHITLDSSLSCVADECQIEVPRVVQVNDSYFEYVQVPCVHQAFYNGAMKITKQYSWHTDASMCANPKLPEASAACCEKFDRQTATRTNVFDGERMTFSAADSRCGNMDDYYELCDFGMVKGNDERHKNSNFFWTSDPCEIMVKVNVGGMVAIVQRPPDYGKLLRHVQENNENYFKVFWKSGNFPKASNDNCDEDCEPLDDGSCLCSTTVAERQAFQTIPSNRQIVLDNLFIGAPDPANFGPNVYSSSYNPVTGIKTYVKNGQMDKNTIFEFMDDKGRQIRLKNTKEIVMIQNGNYSFRNTPHFMSLAKFEETRR